MSIIRQDDLIQSIADALQFISYYHPVDYIRALGRAYEREQSPAAKDAIAQIRKGAVKKGDPLQAARLAGIMAAKQTSALIPLCHPLPISSVNIELLPTATGYEIESRVRTTAQTGVEMEALTAVSVAALTIYDMVKAVDKRMVIGQIRLLRKTGGKSGTFVR